jgi:factor associated with neutral sphingomyelinase activation
MAVKCRFIKPEGNEYGIFSIQRDDGIKYIPLINNPKGKILMWSLSDVKFFLKYRYMFK